MCNKVFVEATNTGLVSKHIMEFSDLFKNTGINTERLIQKIMEVNLRCSFFIYTTVDEIPIGCLTELKTVSFNCVLPGQIQV